MKSFILSEFPSIETAEDLLNMLNAVRESIAPAERPFTLKQLIYLSRPSRTRYYSFEIKKKSGKMRKISAPCARLKLIQTCINEILKTYYEPNGHACGFVPGKSIVDGADMHTNQHYVLNIDLKDFFDCFEIYQIRQIFANPPFGLPQGNSSSPAYLMAALCCQKKEVERVVDGQECKVERWVTPQGAPTSPMLTNLACISMDRRLAGLAQQFGARYSRYADDITFSHSKNIFKHGSSFWKQLESIIGSMPNLRINAEKTRMQGRHYRQEVTGLTVNDRVNVSKRYVKDLRKWIYYIERYGVRRADKFYSQAYMADKGHVKRFYPGILYVMRGKLDFLKMVRGADDPVYKKLAERMSAAPSGGKAGLAQNQGGIGSKASVDTILKALIESLQ